MLLFLRGGMNWGSTIASYWSQSSPFTAGTAPLRDQLHSQQVGKYDTLGIRHIDTSKAINISHSAPLLAQNQLLGQQVRHFGHYALGTYIKKCH